eukprot:1473923-Alexandrium_andersonii.AAC.1
MPGCRWGDASRAGAEEGQSSVLACLLLADVAALLVCFGMEDNLRRGFVSLSLVRRWRAMGFVPWPMRLDG